MLAEKLKPEVVLFTGCTIQAKTVTLSTSLHKLQFFKYKTSQLLLTYK